MSKSIFVIVLALLPVAAMAHAVSGSGDISELYHPVGGWDHFLVIVAVGMIGSQLGKRAIGLVAVSLASAVIGGGVINLWQHVISAAEWWIAISIIFLGLQLALPKRIPILFTYLIILVVGLSHGYEHSSRLAQATEAVLYVVSFVVTTISLYMMGVFIGLIAIRTQRGVYKLRVFGTVIAMVGVSLVSVVQ